MVLTVMWENVLTMVGEDVRVIALVSSVSCVDVTTHHSSPLLGLIQLACEPVKAVDD